MHCRGPAVALIALVLCASVPRAQPARDLDASVQQFDRTAVLRAWAAAADLIARKDEERLRAHVALPFRSGGLAASLVRLGGGRWLRASQVELGAGYARLVVGPEKHEVFLVAEEGRLVLTERWAALTAGWATRESPHFIYRYAADREDAPTGVPYPTDAAVALLERHRAWLVTVFGMDPPGKLTIHLAGSTAEMRRIFGRADARGFIHGSGGIVVAFPHGVFAQVTTAFHYAAIEERPSRDRENRLRFWLRAVAMMGDGDGGMVRGTSAFEVARLILAMSPRPPFSDALSNPNDPTAVARGAALARYFSEEYGRERFRRLVRAVRSDGDLSAAVERIYGTSIETAEREMYRWIIQYAPPPPPLEERVTFRIVTEGWDVQRIGSCRVYVDGGMPFPPLVRLGRIVALHRLRTGAGEFSPPAIYLVRTTDRLRELGITGPSYIGPGVLMSTGLEPLEAALSDAANGR